MATRMSNLALRNKCGNFIKVDPVPEALNEMIQDALITANREIMDIDVVSLAWMRESYNELFTRAYANISAATKADPCVLTAASHDTGVTGHGFQNDDIVFVDSINGMDQLNRRILRINCPDTTTLELYQLNDQNAIVSTDYDAYASGGKIYHCGVKIPHTTIEPTAPVDADYRWTIKQIFAATFDLYPATPMAAEVSFADRRYWASVGRPSKWRYERYGYSQLDSSPEHFLMFSNPADKQYNIEIHIERTYPDLGTWDNSTYPPHPPEIHDCIWRRALANLGTNAEKQHGKRRGGERISHDIEVLYSQFWSRKALEDERFIKEFSRNLLGAQPSQGLSVRFNNPGLVHGVSSGMRAARP
ncbi:MAG: hypothetical protein IMF18_11105 [Proteobacteria bacterium]|nr:hypothetical protein [Pseudomonadota bacterium]